MPLSSLKGKLKYHLNFRIGALVNDSRTFLWTKCYAGMSFSQNKGNPSIGGGNFLIILGAFACLNLLVKIYWIISNDPKSYSLSKNRFNINEKDAFYNLVKDLYKSGITLGLGEEKEVIYKAWDDLRYSLNHLAVPRRLVVAFPAEFLNNKNYSECLEALKITYKTPFLRLKNEDIVVSELLNESVEEIAKWIFNKIDDTSIVEDKINSCLKLLGV